MVGFQSQLEIDKLLKRLFGGLVADHIINYDRLNAYHPQFEIENLITNQFTSLVADLIIDYYLVELQNDYYKKWIEIHFAIRNNYRNFGEKVTFNISRNGDLLFGFFFKKVLPVHNINPYTFALQQNDNQPSGRVDLSRLSNLVWSFDHQINEESQGTNDDISAAAAAPA